MPFTSSPHTIGASSLAAEPVTHGGETWLRIRVHGARGEPVEHNFFFDAGPTTVAYIRAMAAAINAVPLAVVAEREAARHATERAVSGPRASKGAV